MSSAVLRFLCVHMAIVALAAVAFAAPARADWHVASSPHFEIYSDSKGERVEAFAERLERYHSAMLMVLGRELPPPSPSNRVTIFVVDHSQEVRDFINNNNRYAAGVYIARPGDIVALAPPLQSAGGKLAMSNETVLRHEYAHHLMFQLSGLTYPLWYQEGFAEFFASGREERDGTVLIGAPANHRALELDRMATIKAAELLDTTGYLASKDNRRYDQFYGRAWLLYHYLTFDGDRKGQLNRYVALLTEGRNEMEAACEAFGDLDELHRELWSYMRRKRMTTIAIPTDKLPPPRVSVRKLSDGEADIMPVVMQSRVGVNKERAKEVVATAREIAARHPNDPAVLEALAEAEVDAGFFDSADAAADRALAIDPTRTRARLQKMFAAIKRARNASGDADAWKVARREIAATNALETDHPLPLIAYYDSFVGQGSAVPDLALQGLQRALQLAPYNAGLRMTVATNYLEGGNSKMARATLLPLAHSPHRSSATAAAADMVAAIDAAEKPGAEAKSSAADAAPTLP